MSNPDEVAAHEHATWQSAAESYASNISPLTALAGQPEILKEGGRISSTDRVLELGCGPGDLTRQLADMAQSVAAIDFSENMIDIAKVRYPDLSFEVADAERLPYEDESFDVVISNYTAHHFARPQIVFEEARRVLNSSGRLAVVMPIQTEQMSFATVMNAIFEEIPPEESPGGPLLNSTMPEELTRVLEAAGFNDVGGEKRLKPTRLPTADVIVAAGWDFMSMHERPRQMQDRIRTRVHENAETYRLSDGSFEFPDKVLVAWGNR
jgi:SAM-dependent methyltransferase